MLAARLMMGACGGAGDSTIGTFGYLSGGFTTGGVATSEKLPFATESLTSGTALSSARYGVLGMSNFGTALYQAGGVAGARVTTVDKFNAAESRSTLGTGLSSARQNGSVGSYNTGVAGYHQGGETGSVVATSDKFSYSDDSRSTLGAGLGTAVWNHAGVSDDGTAGYCLGGATNSATSATTSAIQKRTYSTDGASTLGATLNAAKFGGIGMSHHQTAGYFSGGATASYASVLSTVRKLTFSTETESAGSGNRVYALAIGAGFEEPTTVGYSLCGYTGAANSGRYEKYPFATETAAEVTGSPTTARRAVGGAGL